MLVAALREEGLEVEHEPFREERSAQTLVESISAGLIVRGVEMMLEPAIARAWAKIRRPGVTLKGKHAKD
jgi:hypothetical protein